ncbi:MAG TPA: DUF192 domain-containing protein [Candidimonas sp.]|nr:DUF192 domain-containing protein [Candidimonas sp.]
MTCVPPLRLYVAATFWQRLRGLHAWPGVPWHAGLWLFPCKAIHTFGLAYAIDVLFIDQQGGVLECIAALAPGRFAWNWNAVGVVELPPGYCAAYPAYAAAVRRALDTPGRGRPSSIFTST